MKTVVVNLRKEKYDVYIGRPSEWGNPFQDGPRQENIENYRKYILTQPKLLVNLYKLKGKRLGCFCKPKACHGDVLVELIEQYLGP
jgi:hypothetical protein